MFVIIRQVVVYRAKMAFIFHKNNLCHLKKGYIKDSLINVD